MLHSMRIMLPQIGDKHVTWDPADQASVDNAQKEYDEAIGQGHRAFRVEKGKPGEPIEQFDPAHQELLLVAALQGG